eukprot:13218337-Ditylum_brightwellii.AAC.1
MIDGASVVGEMCACGTRCDEPKCGTICLHSPPPILQTLQLLFLYAKLKFYNFFKLKAEPILTADFDAWTASYTCFYHKNFQQNKQDLLGHIKCSTESYTQAKDDVDGLHNEIVELKDSIFTMREQFDQKLATMAFEFN